MILIKYFDADKHKRTSIFIFLKNWN